MDLAYVVNDESYIYRRGINKSSIQWQAAAEADSRYLKHGSSCGSSSTSAGTTSTDSYWGFKAHPYLDHTFYIYARSLSDCRQVWLTASTTCATTTLTLSDHPSDEGLWELDYEAQADWDNDPYTFDGKYTLRSFSREEGDCEDTVIGYDGSKFRLLDQRALDGADNLATADNSMMKISGLNFLLFQL